MKSFLRKIGIGGNKKCTAFGISLSSKHSGEESELAWDYFRKLEKFGTRWNFQTKHREAFEKVAKAIASESPEVHVAFIIETLNIVDYMRQRCVEEGNKNVKFYDVQQYPQFPWSCYEVVDRLFRVKLPFTEEDLLFMLNCTSKLCQIGSYSIPYLKKLIKLTENCFKGKEISDEIDNALMKIYSELLWSGDVAELRLRDRINVLRKGTRINPIVFGEAWSDQAIKYLRSIDESKLEVWLDLIQHCENTSGGKPSKKWLKKAESLIDQVGRDSFLNCVIQWFPLVDKPRTVHVEPRYAGQPDPNLTLLEVHANILKGLVWCCAIFENENLPRILTALAISCYRKVPGKGPRAIKIGNACLNILGAIEGMEGVHQLAILKVKVRFRTALKLIDKALEGTAERLGIGRDELEEMSVPGYGLTDVGVLEEEMGSFTARLTVVSSSGTELVWVKSDGKVQKSVPAEVKRDFKEELKELKAGAKDIQKMLPAQKERIENLFLRQKSWGYPVWKERYLDHPLVGTLGRRIIWKFRTGNKEADGIWLDGGLVDVKGEAIEGLGEDTTVCLWHPIGNVADYVVAWRGFLVEHEIVQPFKQAHREIYVLTDAERTTGVYSNRYASHIVKQHQFNALCGVRGWHNTLKLMVDDTFPPASIELGEWGLRAEFWTDGAGDEYGEDTNDTGTFYYLATDQVRFFEIDDARTQGHAFDRGQRGTVDPVPLSEIPALVFSEVMRDVDLFVGVASVGNDPTWSDGGRDGRYRDYWHGFSFGSLSAAANIRKEVLEGLVPRLKIGGRCCIEGKFLKVRGDIRGYKIHMGSGNILMEPNDEYLCIVASRGMGKSGPGGKVFLPFEGDGMLSVILSKAFLLAEDRKIKDGTILRQIRK